MSNRALVDANYLYALHDQTDDWHERAFRHAAESKLDSIVPYVVLTEVSFFLLTRAGGVPTVLEFLDSLVQANVRFEPLRVEDLRRARQIMAKYADNRFDFVDCCIMALAERLNITQVCTFDRRDFSVFRPKHCEYLELLP